MMKMIKYQCSYCNTLYDEGSCPSCGALREDAIKINYTPDVESRKRELAKGTGFEFFYQIIYTAHFFVGLTYAGVWLAIPTSVFHIISIFAMKKKPKNNVYNGFEVQGQKKITFSKVIRIMDIILCAFYMVLWIMAVIYAAFDLL